MYIRTTISLFICVLFLFAFSPQKLIVVFQQIKAEVETNGQSYSKLSEATSSIGHRLTGSPNGKKAEEFIYKSLKDYGFSDVKYLPFEMNAWSRNRVTLSVVPANSDNFRDVEVVALAHSPVSAHVTAQIVDCGDGLPEDYDNIKEALQGKIALFNINIQKKSNLGKSNLHRSEKTSIAIENGAAGVIIANAVEGGVLLTGTASVTGELIPIPALCVSVESGKAIRKWIRDEKNILAVIDMQNYSRPVSTRNIKATYPGSSKKLSKEKIIIGAHLDSWDLAQGAVDNGIGAFSVLDIARTFQKMKLKTKRTIEFVFFMGEEQGLLGSEEFVKNLEKTSSKSEVKLMINLDMVNNANGFNAFGHDKLKEYFENTGKIIQEADKDYLNMNKNIAGLHSDHQPFMISGIPVSSPNGTLSIKALNCYHANCDKIDLINKDDLTNNVKYTAMMLYALANLDEIPVKTMNDMETQNYLTKQGLKQPLIIAKNWPWAE